MHSIILNKLEFKISFHTLYLPKKNTPTYVYTDMCTCKYVTA